MNKTLVRTGIVTAVALAAAAVAPAQPAHALRGPICTHGVDLVVGVNVSVTYTYSKTKSSFQWNGHGYDHIHAYWTKITYFTNPGPNGYWTYKNCGGK